jgi:hypothetical protein
MMTLPSATSGAPVIPYERLRSTVNADQTGLPVRASSAIRRPSSVPT